MRIILVNDEVRRTWKEADMVYFKALFQNLHRRTEEATKSSLKAGQRPRFESRTLPNTKHKD
jgi:hypothetical protein